MPVLRYCVFTMDECWWCDELDKYIARPKRPNSCKAWIFNEMAADDMEKKFKPRPKRRYRQMKLDFM